MAKVNDAVPGDLRSVYSSLQNFIDRSGFPQVFDNLQADARRERRRAR